MLSMNGQFINQKTPNEIAKSLADKIKANRKNLRISQEVLAQKSGVSLGSIKRFETKYEISLQSFIKIAIALDLDNDFENLFTQKTYASIDEIIKG
jgi:transcriptional regulator with XRE-family HTH domain